MCNALDDFLKTRTTSPLLAGARLLRDNFEQLEQQVQGLKSEESDSRKLIGKPAPDFTLNDPAGKPVKLSDSRGKVTLLVFWGMGCRLCRTEAPLLTELFDKYKNRGFSVVAVECFDNDAADIRTYIAEQKLHHPVAIKGSEVAASKYFLGGLPRLLDRRLRPGGRPGDRLRQQADLGKPNRRAARKASSAGRGRKPVGPMSGESSHVHASSDLHRRRLAAGRPMHRARPRIRRRAGPRRVHQQYRHAVREPAGRAI